MLLGSPKSRLTITYRVVRRHCQWAIELQSDKKDPQRKKGAVTVRELQVCSTALTEQPQGRNCGVVDEVFGLLSLACGVDNI